MVVCVHLSYVHVHTVLTAFERINVNIWYCTYDYIRGAELYRGGHC